MCVYMCVCVYVYVYIYQIFLKKSLEILLKDISLYQFVILFNKHSVVEFV